MTLEAGAGGLRDVAVGATREEAADAFGEYFEDAFFTSYDEFDAEIDLALLRSLGLVAGDGLTAVLPRVLARHNGPGASEPRVVLGLMPDVDRRQVVEEVLASHPSVTFTQVLESSDSVLVPLEPVGESTGSIDAPFHRLSAELPPPLPVSARTMQNTSEDLPRASSPETAAGPHPPAPVGRWGRRRFLLAAAVLAFVALVVLLVAGLVGGADGVLLMAIMFLAASQCAMLLALLYVVRLVRELGEDRVEQAAFREQMRRRTHRLIHVSKNSVRLQRENMATAQKARTEVAGVRNRVMAVGKLLSRAGAIRHEDAETQSVRERPDKAP